jgi:hypothetical protein
LRSGRVKKNQGLLSSGKRHDYLLFFLVAVGAGKVAVFGGDQSQALDFHCSVCGEKISKR